MRNLSGNGDNQQHNAKDPSEQQILRWVRPEILALKAYHVNEARGLIKLDAMENPYDLPAAIVDKAMARVGKLKVNRYPDPEANHLKSALKQLYGLHDQTALMFGNGSDEIIQILAMVLGGPDRTILSVEPGFVMYKMIAVFTGSHYAGIPLTADFAIDIDATLAAIKQHQPSLVFIAQPNNPTGNLFADQALKAIVREAPGVVVIDEAYTAFTDADYLSWLAEFSNLLIMRTFSKLGLAGLRFGMLFGHPRWIDQLNKVRLPYNINSLTQQTVAAATQEFGELLAQTSKLREEREVLAAKLRNIKELRVYPSEANFILIRLPHSAKKIFEDLRTSGILVKLLDGSHSLLAECLRITVGTREENEAFLTAFTHHYRLTGITGECG